MSLVERRDLAHLPPAHQAEVNREADVVESRLLLLVDTHVIAFAIGQRHLGEIFEREAEAFASTSLRNSSGP